MWPLLVIAVIGAWLYTNARSTSTQPGGNVAPLPGGTVNPPLLNQNNPTTPAGSLIATSMTNGAYYAFSIVSSLDAATLTSELANVGAIVQGVPIQAGSVWTGVYQWQGQTGEPTENLPGITWESLLEIPSLAPAPTQAVVSGHYDEPAHMLQGRIGPQSFGLANQEDPVGHADQVLQGYGHPPHSGQCSS